MKRTRFAVAVLAVSAFGIASAPAAFAATPGQASASAQAVNIDIPGAR